MKPETPTPISVPERQPVTYEVGIESGAISNDNKLERESSAERKEQTAEANALAADIGLTSVIPTPVVVNPVAADDTTAQNSPLVANDDDLIEKEWVDRAKKIVAETQNDPKLRDDKISMLKVDYVKKRFGRELGAAE